MAWPSNLSPTRNVTSLTSDRRFNLAKHYRMITGEIPNAEQHAKQYAQHLVNEFVDSIERFGAGDQLVRLIRAPHYLRSVASSAIAQREGHNIAPPLSLYSNPQILEGMLASNPRGREGVSATELRRYNCVCDNHGKSWKSVLLPVDGGGGAGDDSILFSSLSAMPCALCETRCIICKGSDAATPRRTRNFRNTQKTVGSS